MVNKPTFSSIGDCPIRIECDGRNYRVFVSAEKFGGVEITDRLTIWAWDAIRDAERYDIHPSEAQLRTMAHDWLKLETLRRSNAAHWKQRALKVASVAAILLVMLPGCTGCAIHDQREFGDRVYREAYGELLPPPKGSCQGNGYHPPPTPEQKTRAHYFPPPGTVYEREDCKTQGQ